MRRDQGAGREGRHSQSSIDKYWSAQKETGQLNWANWPLYIDTDGKSKHPTLEKFQKETGIKVKYVEAIQDNGPFFAKVQPSLSDGQYSGYDLAVITSGIVLQQVPAISASSCRSTRTGSRTSTRTPAASTRTRRTTPATCCRIPWQGGFTGIGYNPEKTGREITSWEDLTDPKFKGHIGMMGNNEDLPNIALLAIGKDPQTSTQADWQKAADWLNR